ncbi:MAG: N-acetyltransferase [Proteobacteria bacterium]|nr:N-acetyltransferase [Pseudomonadota bacterium]
MNIRPETFADHAAIRKINNAAFAVHLFSRQTAHLIVDALRAEGALTVSLVAEDVLAGDVRIVGHIAFSKEPVDGRDLGWYLLGPVAVLPDLQRKGIGSKLVLAGLAKLRKRNAAGCALVGDPALYARLGFRQAVGLSWPGVPAKFVLYQPLCGDEPNGAISHHPAFNIEA